MKANAVAEWQGDSIYLPLGFFRHIIYRIYKDFLVSHKDHKGHIVLQSLQSLCPLWLKISCKSCNNVSKDVG